MCEVRLEALESDGNDIRRRAVVVLLTLGIMIVVGVGILGRGPIHSAYCLLEGRDGWIVDLPANPESPEEIQVAVREQTRCVRVILVPVESDGTKDGTIVAVEGAPPRTWVPYGGAIRVFVTRSSDRVPSTRRSTLISVA